MAGIMDDVYEFLAAPARQRNANEAARTDAMANAPKFSDLAGMKVDQRLAPSPAAPLLSPVGAQQIGMSLTGNRGLYGPPIGGNVASSMDLAAMEKLAGPAPAKGTPAYASWLAAGRAAFFNAMNGGLPPQMPIDSDIPLNSYNVPTAQQSAAGRSSGGSRGMSLGSLPTFITGSHTGNRYNFGQNYTTPTGIIKTLGPDGTFTTVGRVGDESSAERYAAAVSRNNSRSGRTSSGQSRTNSDGTSWASSYSSSGGGGGGSSLASSRDNGEAE